MIIAIGLDLAKRIFEVHGADAEGPSMFNRKLRRSEVLRFLRSCQHAWWEWKHAVAPTIGRARSQLSVMRCGSFRRLMSNRSSSVAKQMRRTRRPSAKR